MSTEIIYNGSTIAALTEGQSANLNCIGKIAATNISVNFDTSGSVAYNGIVTEVEPGRRVILNCADKLMQDTVTVVVLADDIEKYTITVNAEDMVEINVNTAPSTISKGETVVFRLVASSTSWSMSPWVTVVGADWTYEPAYTFDGCINYTITLSNPVDDVVITISEFKPGPGPIPDLEPE